MKNAELIATIRNEIESLKSIEYPCDNSQQATGFFNALDIMTDFLSTLESEKPMKQEGLEEEIERCVIEPYYDLNGVAVKGATAYITVNDVADIARHFAQWGYLRAAEKYNEIEYNRQRAEESVPNDPEEAAEKYAKTTFKKPYSDNPDEEVTIVEPDKYAGFLAGAKWQKQHDAELIEIAYNDGITIGMTKQKEQMMKEAVEGEYDFYPAAVYLDVPIPRMNHGDKVRVIVIPNTDEK